MAVITTNFHAVCRDVKPDTRVEIVWELIQDPRSIRGESTKSTDRLVRRWSGQTLARVPEAAS